MAIKFLNTVQVDTDVLYVDAANDRVGIGLSSPSTTLHVDGFTRMNGGLQMNIANAQIYQILDSALRFGTNNTERMRISSTGNVGIGTTNPNANLDIEDASGVTIDINSSSGDGQFRFQDDGVTKWSVGRDNTQQNFVFSNSSGLSSDNVLTLAHSTGDATFAGDVTLANGNSLRWTSDDVRIEGTTAGDNIKFYVANTEILQLAQSGTLATVTGNLRVTGAYYDSGNTPGTANQILASTATGTSWIDPSTIVAEAATLVVIACKNTSGAAIAQGTPVYQTGTVGATATIEIAPADALISANKLPAIGLLQTDLNNNGFGNVVITGELTNFTTSPIDGVVPITGDKVFVKSGGGLTLTKPTGEGNGIQNMGLVGKVSSGNSGSITVSSIMRTNDVPNLPEGRIWIGDGNTIVSDTVYVDEPNNRVGIGTTSPSAALNIVNSNPKIVLEDSDNIGTFGQIRQQAGNLQFLSNNNTANGTIQFKLDDGTNITDAMYISSAGNVGIGTTSPGRLLDVDGIQGWSEGTNVEKAYLNPTGTGTDFNLLGDNGDIRFDSRAGSNSYINTGNVGIGTTSPTSKLDVVGTGSFTGQVTIPATPVASTDAASKSYVDAHGGGTGPFLPLAGGTMTGDLKLNDNVVAKFGNSDDLQIYHDGSNSYIKEIGTGNLRIRSTSLRLEGTDSSNMVVANQGDSVSLYYNASKKFETSNGGVSVTGNGIFTGNVGIGTTSPSQKLEVSTDGYEVSKFAGNTDDGTGYVGAVVEIETNNDSRGRGVYLTHREDTDTSDSEWYAGVPYTGEGYSIGNAAYGTSINSDTGPAHKDQSKIFIKEDGNVGIGTTSPGEKLEVAGNIKLNDNNQLLLGTSSDLEIFHDAADSIINNNVGHLYISQKADDKDIIFRSDDSSGGLAEYFRVDGGAVKVIASKNFAFTDNVKAEFGDSGDLQIYHDGSNSYINDTDTGDLYIQAGDNMYFQTYGSGKRWITLTENAGVDLFYNDTKRLATTSTGVTVTGGLTVSGTNSFLIESNNTAATFNLNSSARGFDFINNNGTLLNLDSDGNGTFADQAFATTATSSGDASSTLTTKGYVDGLITGATIYRGAWDPSGGGYGSPDLSTVTQTSGYYYICSAAGTAEPNGTGTEPDTWETGDWVIYNDVSGTGQWQKIDNSSVLSGVGTGQTVALWEGAGSVTDSETLGNAPITVSGNDTTFAGDITVSGGDIVSNGNTVVSNSANANTLRVGDALLASTTQTIKFRTNGADALTIDTSQNATFAGDVYIPEYIYHSGDTNTYIRFTADTQTFRTGGDDRLILTNTTATFSGAIGVGGTTPSDNYAIDITPSGGNIIRSTRGTSVFGSYQSNNSDVYLGTISNNTFKIITNDTVALTLDTSQNATFAGDVSLGLNYAVSFNNSNDKIGSFTNGDVSMAARNNIGIYADSDGGGDGVIDFHTGDAINAGSPKMTILNNGNVGIGTASPTARLDILTNSATGNSNIDKYIRFRADNGEQRFNFKVGQSGNAANLEMYNGAEVQKVKIDTNGDSYFDGGNVGIGATGPLNKLQVSGGSVGIDSEYMIRDNRNNTILLQSPSTTITNRTLSIGNATYNNIIIPNGNVGIGTTSPTEKLVVDGKIIINNTTPPNNLAQLNIGSTSGGETRAIDIDGNWTAGESKSITFAYGTDATHMVGQINCVFNTSTDSRLRWGKLYHGGVSSTYTMELKSTSTTTANLTVAGSIQIADDTDTASADKVGTLKYRVSGNNSYVDMCMQTGATTYAWINIVQNNW